MEWVCFVPCAVYVWAAAETARTLLLLLLRLFVTTVDRVSGAVACKFGEAAGRPGFAGRLLVGSANVETRTAKAHS